MLQALFFGLQRDDFDLQVCHLLGELGGLDRLERRDAARLGRLLSLEESLELLLSVLYLAAAIVLEICGTTSLKLSQGFTRIGPTGAVAVCYAASFALLSLALRGIDLSIAYAVWSGVGTAIVASIGIIWFDEPAGAWKLLSLALIVLGVAGLHLSGRVS